MSEISSLRRRENQELCHLTAKRQGFGRKMPNETIVMMMHDAKGQTDNQPFTEYLHDV